LAGWFNFVQIKPRITIDEGKSLVKIVLDYLKKIVLDYLKLGKYRIRPDIRKKSFTMRVVKH